MSNNCLVTRLKANVDNNNLPVLNVLSFDCTATSRQDPEIWIMTGSKQVVLKSQINLYQSTSYTNPVQELTIGANTMKTIYLKTVDVQTSISDCFSIEGEGIYELKKLGSNFVNFQPSVKNNLRSQEYNESLRAYGGAFVSPSADIELPTGLQYIQLNSFDSKYANSPYNLRVYRTTNSLPLDGVTKANTSILVVVDVTGDIINLPKNIQEFSASKGASIFGSIESLVARLIEEGRTNGKIVIRGITSSTAITVGGHPLYQTTGVGVKVLEWNNSGTISWSDTIPEGIPNKDLKYYVIV